MVVRLWGGTLWEVAEVLPPGPSPCSTIVCSTIVEAWHHRLTVIFLTTVFVRAIRGSCTHRARTVRSFDIFIFTGSVSPPFQLRFIMSLSWVTPGMDVFYNCASTGD